MLQKSPMYSYNPVSDLARARKFYEQKLGFQPTREVAGGVVYECGDHTSCFMYPTPNAGTSQASQAFWEVADENSLMPATTLMRVGAASIEDPAVNPVSPSMAGTRLKCAGSDATAPR